MRVLHAGAPAVEVPCPYSDMAGRFGMREDQESALAHRLHHRHPRWRGASHRLPPSPRDDVSCRSRQPGRPPCLGGQCEDTPAAATRRARGGPTRPPIHIRDARSAYGRNARRHAAAGRRQRTFLMHHHTCDAAAALARPSLPCAPWARKRPKNRARPSGKASHGSRRDLRRSAVACMRRTSTCQRRSARVSSQTGRLHAGARGGGAAAASGVRCRLLHWRPRGWPGMSRSGAA